LITRLVPDGRQATIADLRTELVATVQQPGFAAAIKKKSGVALSQPERDALNRYRDIQQAFQRLQTAAVAAADDVEQPSIADYLTRGEMPPVDHWMTMRDMTDLLGEQMTEPTAITAPGTVILPPCVAEDDSFPSLMNHVRARAGELGGEIHFQSPMLVTFSLGEGERHHECCRCIDSRGCTIPWAMFLVTVTLAQ
jgi:hypothetical protein